MRESEEQMEEEEDERGPQWVGEIDCIDVGLQPDFLEAEEDLFSVVFVIVVGAADLLEIEDLLEGGSVHVV